MDARPWLPDGSEFTAESTDTESELSLFMLSLAVYPQAHVVPSSYYGARFPELSGRARYVIDEGCGLAGRPGRRALARLSGGCVEIRE